MAESYSTESVAVENWKPIEGFPGYEVSDLGRVRSYHTSISLGIGKGSRPGISDRPRLLVQTSVKKGYKTVSVIGAKSRNQLVHRLVLLAFVGPCPAGCEGCHGASGVSDNSLSNLCWGTKSQNHGKDRLRDGTDNRGEKHGRAVITQEIAQKIKRRLLNGRGLTQIASELGVARHHVKNIKNKKAWAWLSDEVML